MAVPVCAFSAASPGIVIDAHNDTVQNLVVEGADFGVRSTHGGIDLPRLREGGVTVPFFAANVPSYYPEAEAVRRTLDFRDAMQRVFDKYPNDIELATSARQIERLVGKGKIAAVLAIEGGHQIGDDLAVLRSFRRLGFLSMTLTHFKGNHWADSATSPPLHDGLTDFGRQVVREMNRIGMIVDVSHTSDKTFYDTLAVSTKPVIASHSSCRALVDLPRNMDDKMLRAVAENGGVVGINFYSAYVSTEDADDARKLIKSVNAIDTSLAGPTLDTFAVKQRIESGESNPIVGNASIADVVACVAHAVEVAGIDHVGSVPILMVFRVCPTDSRISPRSLPCGRPSMTMVTRIPTSERLWEKTSCGSFEKLSGSEVQKAEYTGRIAVLASRYLPLAGGGLGSSVAIPVVSDAGSKIDVRTRDSCQAPFEREKKFPLLST